MAHHIGCHRAYTCDNSHGYAAMRRLFIISLLVLGFVALSGCGNKGPLVRGPATPAHDTSPAPATTAMLPASDADVTGGSSH
jgi:predicted small lipoprotein YifL